MEFRISHPEDITQLVENGISGSKFDNLQEEIDFCATLEHQGKVLIVGGIRKITPTTAWAYAELTYNALEHIYTVYRVAKEWTDKLCRENGIIRLQAWVEADVKERENWVRHMGFEREGGLLPHFAGKGVSAYIYVKYYEV